MYQQYLAFFLRATGRQKVLFFYVMLSCTARLKCYIFYKIRTSKRHIKSKHAKLNKIKIQQ